MTADYDDLSDFVHEAPKLKKTRRRFRLVEIVTVLGIIGVTIALLLPAVRTAWPAALRMQCTSNLKNIALALHSYESTYKVLPPVHTVDADGRPLHSWRTLILPFMEQQKLYESIDLSKPWNYLRNAEAYKTRISTFRCPAADCPANLTTYLAVVTPNGRFRSNKPRQLSEITDDHRETLMVIEASSTNAVHWMAPVDADENLVMAIDPSTKLDHPGGTNATYVDGNVRFPKSSTPMAERRALISIAGKDK